MSTKAESAEGTIEIKKTIVVDASPQAVFKAITDPSELTNWFPDNAMFDGRIGGKTKFSFHKNKSTEEHSREVEYVSEGTVTEFIPNKKVSYTWQLKDIPDFPETMVTWKLEEIDPHKTKLKLIHSGFTGREEGKLSSKEHDKGWSYFLGRLKDYCEKENN